MPKKSNIKKERFIVPHGFSTQSAGFNAGRVWWKGQAEENWSLMTMREHRVEGSDKVDSTFFLVLLLVTQLLPVPIS